MSCHLETNTGFEGLRRALFGLTCTFCLSLLLSPQHRTSTPPDAGPATSAFHTLWQTLERGSRFAGNVYSYPWFTDTYRFGQYRVPKDVAAAILRASIDAGVPADLMMAVAEKESSFNCRARPARGSAYGCFQFTDQTWLETVKQRGHEVGLHSEAAAIEATVQDERTVYHVGDKTMEGHILALREDPYLTAYLSAVRMQDDTAYLEQRTRSDIQEEDSYLPHLLGRNGAGHLMEQVQDKPDRAADEVFPKAASFNPTLFSNLTVAEFLEHMREGISERRRKYQSLQDVINPLDVVMVPKKVTPVPSPRPATGGR